MTTTPKHTSSATVHPIVPHLHGPRHIRRQHTPTTKTHPQTTELRRQLARAVAALPAAVVVRVQHVDVVRARIALVAHLEGDPVEVLRLPGLGLGDAHELREHVGAGGVGEDGRGWVSAEGDCLDVDAHP